MKIWVTGLLVIMVAAAAFYYFKMDQQSGEVLAPPARPSIVTGQPEPEPVPMRESEPEEFLAEDPVAVEPAPEPEVEAVVLPSLNESDAEVLESLSGISGEAAVMQFLVSDNLVSRFVSSVDTLSARQVPNHIMAVNGPESDFLVTPIEQPAKVVRNAEGDAIPQYLLNPANFKRYTPWVDLLEAADTEQLIAVYQHYSPLFQQAWVELGYPDGSFEQRLIEVIDLLMETPEKSEPLHLIKPEAFYLFADPDLEAMPAGQKILLRIGPDNAKRVKVKLREIRSVLVNGG